MYVRLREVANRMNVKITLRFLERFQLIVENKDKMHSPKTRANVSS